MNLRGMIELFKSLPQDAILEMGLNNPHSWRGSYEELSFEPAGEMKVSKVLRVLKSAIGKTYTGYKGGEYRMDKDTLFNIDNVGCWTDGGSENEWWASFNNSIVKAKDETIAKLSDQVEKQEHLLWEAHQFIGGSLVQIQSEQDHIDIMDKLCASMNKVKNQNLDK